MFVLVMWASPHDACGIASLQDKDACGIASLQDKSFTFILKTPPASVLLLKAAGMHPVD